MKSLSYIMTCAVLALAASCGSSASSAPDAAQSTGNAQTPATGGTAVEAWLAQGFYKSWTCEPAVHAARAPSPHGFNRVCSNDIISPAVTGTGEWPMGAASVKELYDSATGTTPVGYAVALKQAATSNGGANWYWYERVPGTGVIADGTGGSGTPNTICVACHTAVGSDANHTPTPHGRDFVYTPVAPGQ